MIRVSAIRHSYGPVLAVNDVSLDVRKGEMFGLIGPDGAGKTTILRLILGLMPCENGEIKTCGFAPEKERGRLSERIGYLPQRFSLYGDLSVDENIAFFADIHGVDKWKSKRDRLLEQLRLSEFRDRLADRLSGGMKQKLALACTLIHTPDLLVMDEPTTGVDPVSRREFWKILFGLQREGMTIFLTTPYLDESERCGRVALMSRGRILHMDTPQNLKRLERGSVIEILASPRRRAAEILGRDVRVTEVEGFGERLHVAVPSILPAAAGELIREFEAALRAEGVDVKSIRASSPSMEDVFISTIQSRENLKEEVTV